MSLTNLKNRLREWILFDSSAFKSVIGFGALLAAGMLRLAGRRQQGLTLLCWVHRQAVAGHAEPVIERIVRRVWTPGPDGVHPGDSYVAQLTPIPLSEPFFRNPERLIGARMLVLKPWRPGERGVLVIDLTGLFPVIARFFDLEQITERYHLVLEPGWSGFCDPDILFMSKYRRPVFVESYEPRDGQFIERFGANFVPVPLSANWWIDHRVFRPLPGAVKDVDVVMIASWARFKRHAQFFAALQTLKRRGRQLRVTLVGYPNEVTADDIRQLAASFDVADQVEMHEWLSPAAVNEQLNRARVNVIWSRREGVNRAIIEGMLAGVPCIVREGFNYGYRYPYVNEHTGVFASEAGLPDALVSLVDRAESMNPREWVMANMSCEKATEILGTAIRRQALADGEPWTSDLVVHLSLLNTLQYTQPDERALFAADYAYLHTQLRPR